MYNYWGKGTRHGTAQSGVMMACLCQNGEGISMLHDLHEVR